MARTKTTRRRSREPTDIVGLTRCRFPSQRAPDGTPVRTRKTVEFALTIQHLESVAGCRYLSVGRGVDNPDEVLLCTYWADEASLRAFMLSPGYAKYLELLGLGDIQEGDAGHGRAIAVAELKKGSLPLSNLATIFTATFAHPTEPDTIKLEMLRLNVPRSIYDWGRLFPRHYGSGWIIDPQLEGGRLVKKGMAVQIWAVRQPLEKQLEVYKAVTQHAPSRDEWRLRVEESHAVSVDEATWDFGDPNESDESDSEPDQEAELTEKLGDMKVQS